MIWHTYKSTWTPLRREKIKPKIFKENWGQTLDSKWTEVGASHKRAKTKKLDSRTGTSPGTHITVTSKMIIPSFLYCVDDRRQRNRSRGAREAYSRRRFITKNEKISLVKFLPKSKLFQRQMIKWQRVRTYACMHLKVYDHPNRNWNSDRRTMRIRGTKFFSPSFYRLGILLMDGRVIFVCRRDSEQTLSGISITRRLYRRDERGPEYKKDEDRNRNQRFQNCNTPTDRRKDWTSLVS